MVEQPHPPESYDESLIGFIKDIVYDEERQEFVGRLVPLPGREINVGDEFLVTVYLGKPACLGESGEHD